MLKLALQRFLQIGDATIGTLTIDGVFECFTLEDRVRPEKIEKVTAIPTGTYAVKLTKSPRFSAKYEKLKRGSLMPLLVGVPNYDGVRIHVGNKASDTEGCILVGSWKKSYGAKIEKSHDAYVAMLDKLLAHDGKIRISIMHWVATEDPKLRMMKSELYDGLMRPGGPAIA